MKILAIDTALGAASACLFDAVSNEVLARETIWLDRGHDQAIIPLVDRVIADRGGPSLIERIAVTVGPGSFTGIRVGISAARAIGLAVGVPVVGVSTLSAYVAPRLDANAPVRRDGRISPPAGNGLGVAPDPSVLGAPAATFD